MHHDLMAPNTLKNLQNHRLNHLSQNVLLLRVVDSQILLTAPVR